MFAGVDACVIRFTVGVSVYEVSSSIEFALLSVVLSVKAEVAAVEPALVMLPIVNPTAVEAARVAENGLAIVIWVVVREHVRELPSSVAVFPVSSPVQSALVVVVTSEGRTTMICPFAGTVWADVSEKAYVVVS